MKEIFIVEDNLHIQEMLEFLLMDQEYNVKSFATASAFKIAIDKETPDLILMDIRLPDGNGLDLCKGLCMEENKRDIPVFLMSAHAKSSIGSHHCAKEFIPKPFDVDDLIAKVHRQLNPETSIN